VIYLALIGVVYVAGVFAVPALGRQMQQAREKDLPALKVFVVQRAQSIGDWWHAYVGPKREPPPADAEAPVTPKAPPPEVDNEEEGADPPAVFPDAGERVGPDFVVAASREEVVVRREGAFVVLDADDLGRIDPTPATGTRWRFHLHGEGDPHVGGLVAARTEEEIVLRVGDRFRTIARADVDWEEPIEHGEAEFDIVVWLRRNVSLFTRHLDSALELAIRFVSALVGTLYKMVLILMLTAFIVIDRPRIVAFIRDVPPEQHRATYARLLGYFDRGLAGVIRGQLLICLVNGLLTWVGLELLGVRYALLLGLIAGVFSLIPIFGTILSTIPIVLIAWGTGTIAKAALALGWILLIHFLEANFLNPKIMGTASKIHPVVVIFALLAGEHAYGIVGALLAVPAASLLQSAFRFYVLDRQTEVEDPEPTPA
jgi:hypothetical protein